jgi:RimJ/RimL family protein N-acetyltransferase
MYPAQFPGQHVLLREFKQTDVAQTAELLRDDQVTRWSWFDSQAPDAAAIVRGIMTRAQREPRTEYFLAVTQPDDTMVGFTRLGLSGMQAGEIACTINPHHWQRGYATDTVRAVITFGFGVLHLHRISAAVIPDNTASVALTIGLGFQYEGRLRDHVCTNGVWYDTHLYSLLAQEWTERSVHDHLLDTR